MPFFYFDVRDSQGVNRDETGLELPDLDSAIREGRRAPADMNRDALASGSDQVLEILDHGEGPVRLALSTTTEILDQPGDQVSPSPAAR